MAQLLWIMKFAPLSQYPQDTGQLDSAYFKTEFSLLPTTNIF